eukprot:GILI01015115.1.p1 GENE.GILI01015115.1~~GILI01015115.1.p1  ORF type:complete len:163 (-),score=31.45 GILI01015115.1:161-589(-)
MSDASATSSNPSTPSNTANAESAAQTARRPNPRVRVLDISPDQLKARVAAAGQAKAEQPPQLFSMKPWASFDSSLKPKPWPKELRGKNMALTAALCIWIGGTFAYTIHKMSGDFLSQAEKIERNRVEALKKVKALEQPDAKK